MYNDKQLSYNKSLQNVTINMDHDIDLTAVRIGKQRLARKKNEKLSTLKQAIVLHREQPKSEVRAPVVDEVLTNESSECNIVSSVAAEVLMSDSDRMCESLLKELARLQARGKEQPKEKQYKYKKFVVGLREVERALRRNEVKGIVVASNIEDDVEELAMVLSKLKEDCVCKEIPFISALTKRRLGKCLGKSMKQTIVGIVSLEGIHQQWRELVKLVSET